MKVFLFKQPIQCLWLAVISPEQDLSGFAEIAGTKTMICSLNKLVHLEKKRANSEMYIDVINMREMNRVIPLYAPKICTTALWNAI